MFSQKGGSDIVLIDFGMAVKYADRSQMYTRCGTPDYVGKEKDWSQRRQLTAGPAPEVIEPPEGGYDEKVDMWSAGVVLYAMCVIQLRAEGDPAIGLAAGCPSPAPALTRRSPTSSVESSCSLERIGKGCPALVNRKALPRLVSPPYSDGPRQRDAEQGPGKAALSVPGAPE